MAAEAKPKVLIVYYTFTQQTGRVVEALADRAHRRTVRSLGGEQLERGIEQERAPLRPPVGGWHPRPSGRGTERFNTWQRALP